MLIKVTVISKQENNSEKKVLLNTDSIIEISEVDKNEASNYGNNARSVVSTRECGYYAIKESLDEIQNRIDIMNRNTAYDAFTILARKLKEHGIGTN